MKPPALERHWARSDPRLIEKQRSDEGQAIYAQLSQFFVRAFWESKKKEICQGSPLTIDQTQMLEFRQYVDFRERYDASTCLTRSSEMLYVQQIISEPQATYQPFTTPNDPPKNNNRNIIVACAGVECTSLVEPRSKRPVVLHGDDHKDARRNNNPHRTTNTNYNHNNPSPAMTVPIMGDVAVALSHRGQGIARELVLALEDRVAQLWPHQDALYLWVEATNTLARKLYQSLGYRIVHVEKESVFYAPMGQDASSLHAVPTVFMCMQKILRHDSQECG